MVHSFIWCVVCACQPSATSYQPLNMCQTVLLLLRVDAGVCNWDRRGEKRERESENCHFGLSSINSVAVATKSTIQKCHQRAFNVKLLTKLFYLWFTANALQLQPNCIQDIILEALYSIFGIPCWMHWTVEGYYQFHVKGRRTSGLEIKVKQQTEMLIPLKEFEECLLFFFFWFFLVVLLFPLIPGSRKPTNEQWRSDAAQKCHYINHEPARMLVTSSSFVLRTSKYAQFNQKCDVIRFVTTYSSSFYRLGCFSFNEIFFFYYCHWHIFGNMIDR